MTRWFLLLSLVSACGGAPLSSVTTPDVPRTPTLSARLVRQPSAPRDLRVSLYLEADGAHRAVSGDGRELLVTDPFTRAAYAREAMPFAYGASLDPSFTTACVELREMRAGAPTEIGAFDLVHRVWRWREVLIAEGQEGTVARMLATPEMCAAIVRTRSGDTLVLRALDDGAALESTAPIFETLPDTTAMWSDDRSTLVLARPATTPSGESAYYLDVRDGHSLVQRAVIWARCVEVGETVRIAIDERIESEARRAYLGRTLPELLGACETGPSVPSQQPESMALPSPWVPLSDDVVAAHDETGFYLWDHAHHASPRRIEAPPLVRFDDVNGQSRPYELVVPPDASWVGILREDAMLSRFSATDGAPLSDVALPRLPPSEVSSEDAEWQVFAGARDRLLAIRSVNGHRKAFVGDVGGHWTRARCRVFPRIVQAVEHEDATGTWLVSDPHYGVSRVDETTGLVTASFLPTDTWSRITSAARSPDGAELFVGIAASESDDVGGLYVLDAATLAVRRRFPVGVLTAGVDDVEWTREGVVLALHAGFVVDSVWARIDPATGAGEVIAHGPMAIDWAPTRRGAAHLLRAFEGGVFVSDVERRAFRRLRLVEGGAAIEEADGRLWCEGAGCELYRCVVGARELRPATDAACADQRVR